MSEAPLQVQFKKMYSGPINPDSIFKSMEDAIKYATGPTGTPGEIITITDPSVSEGYRAYVIDHDRSLKSTVPEEVTESINEVASSVELTNANVDEIIKALTWNVLP